MGFESSHGLQQLVASEATWQENQTNVIELLGADVATVSGPAAPLEPYLQVDDSKI